MEDPAIGYMQIICERRDHERLTVSGRGERHVARAAVGPPDLVEEKREVLVTLER